MGAIDGLDHGFQTVGLVAQNNYHTVNTGVSK
jgi:hypothetical protein